MKYLRTSDIAKAVGLHPNTIRLYEEWGLLDKIPRSSTGYRLFTQEHLDQVKLVRLVLKCTIFGREIKRASYHIIKTSAIGDFKEALDTARNLKTLIDIECRQAEDAQWYLEQWANNAMPSENKAQENACSKLKAVDVAKLLNITTDMLRDWERNNLINIPRNPANGYRMFGPEEINRLRVIRVLRRSNYSNMAILRAMSKFDTGSSEGLREALDSPEIDEERGYLCFTDTLLSALHIAMDAINEIIRYIESRQVH